MAKRTEKSIIKITASLFILATISCLLPVNSAWAGSCGGTETVLLSCDNDQNGILGVLCLVVSVLTAGIGILALIGVTIAGIQYLTAGGSEEQVRKAKKRIYHAVIGIAAYALMAPMMNFLLPGGLFGCSSESESSEVSESETGSGSGGNSGSSASGSSSGSGSGSSTSRNVDRPASELLQ